MRNAVLVPMPAMGAPHESVPEAPIDTPQRVGVGRPSVELSDDGDPLGIRSPHGEPRPVVFRMGAEVAVGVGKAAVLPALNSLIGEFRHEGEVRSSVRREAGEGFRLAGADRLCIGILHEQVAQTAKRQRSPTGPVVELVADLV